MTHEFVVNLHVTERCNYGCSFCFGKWELANDNALVFEDIHTAQELVLDLMSICPPVPLERAHVRFNFVGGEPALLGSLPELVSFCRGIGVSTSFVSNGLMLRRFTPRWLSINFDIAGLSIDSSSKRTNLTIGRSTRSGATLNLAEISAQVLELKSLGTCIKVNTVVSATNQAEDLTAVIRTLRPDKWKIFQMLPVYGSQDAVNAEEFSNFIVRHIEFKDIICTEDNEEMTASYVMIDPLGRFFWRDEDSAIGYHFSHPILVVGAAKAFSECTVIWERYVHRYE